MGNSGSDHKPHNDHKSYNQSGDFNNTDDNNTSNYTSRPFLLENNSYVVPVHGYFMPIVVLFTVITNVLVCAVLLSRNMRTATNTLLVAMALSDMITGETKLHL